jgi:hypothetical protein
MQNPKKSASTSTDKLNRSNDSSGSKIAAFLPARQLWAWAGKGFKRSTGRVKKQFYRSIQRGKETISVWHGFFDKFKKILNSFSFIK